MGRGGDRRKGRLPRAPDALSADGKQEILIEGRLYDITDFKKRHPGGSVISFYLGTDATEPYREFHCQSGDKADKYLKSLPSRPYTGRQKFDDPVLRDFAVLRNQLREEGFYKPSAAHATYRLTEIAAMHALGAWLLYSGWYWAGIIVLGIVQGRCGWLMHEGGHYSLTTNPSIDVHLQEFLYGVGCGMSAAWWRVQHNKHHATPQKIGADVDLDTLPLLAFNKAVTSWRPKWANKTWLRLQAILFAPIICFLVASGWQLFLHPRHIMRRGLVREAFYLLLRAAFVVYMGTQFGAGVVLRAYCAYVWVGGLYIFTNFAVSHTHLPVVPSDEHRDWVRYAAEHTMNVQPSWWCNWWMAYLNFQIEHHLFPCMPQFRHPQVSPRVEALFRKHGLVYMKRSYWDAVRVTFANLHKVGQEVFYG